MKQLTLPSVFVPLTKNKPLLFYQRNRRLKDLLNRACRSQTFKTLPTIQTPLQTVLKSTNQQEFQMDTYMRKPIPCSSITAYRFKTISTSRQQTADL